MKKQHLFGGLLISALMLIAAGCSNEELLSTSGDSVEINVKSTAGTIGGNASRATLANDAKTPNWEADDKIAVIVDEGSASELSLTSGAGTVSGTFKGKIPSEGTNMYFYYPASAASGNVVDLTTQDGSNAKEMVMFASADYSTEPSIAFQNKTSILKLNIPVPTESGWTTSTTDLSATVIGAYSKGKLSKEGEWSDLEATSISVSNIMVSSDGKLTGYAVVIPGTKVTDLRIAVTDGTNYYVTNTYTNAEATVPENNVVAISRATTKALLWNPGTTKADDVKSFLGTGTDLNIVAASEMGTGDFDEIRTALWSCTKGTINLTLSNQTSLPSSSSGVLRLCYALKSVSAPQVTCVGDRAFQNCLALTTIDFPLAKSVNVFAFDGCSALTTINLPLAESVGKSAFYSCPLETLNLPSATEVASDAFNSVNTSIADLTVKAGTTWWQSYEWFSVKDDNGNTLKESPWD